MLFTKKWRSTCLQPCKGFERKSRCSNTGSMLTLKPKGKYPLPKVCANFELFCFDRTDGDQANSPILMQNSKLLICRRNVVTVHPVAKSKHGNMMDSSSFKRSMKPKAMFKPRWQTDILLILVFSLIPPAKEERQSKLTSYKMLF